MAKISVFLAMILLAEASYDYRFICNGLLANGLQRQDNCGVCDDQHAPRWEEPIITVLIGLELRPAGIQKEDW